MMKYVAITESMLEDDYGTVEKVRARIEDRETFNNDEFFAWPSISVYDNLDAAVMAKQMTLGRRLADHIGHGDKYIIGIALIYEWDTDILGEFRSPMPLGEYMDWIRSEGKVDQLTLNTMDLIIGDWDIGTVRDLHEMLIGARYHGEIGNGEDFDVSKYIFEQPIEIVIAEV